MTRFLPHSASRILKLYHSTEWRRVADPSDEQTTNNLVKAGWLQRFERFDSGSSWYEYRLAPKAVRLLSLSGEERGVVLTASAKTLKGLKSFEFRTPVDGRTLVAMCARGWLQLSEAGQRALAVVAEEEDS